MTKNRAACFRIFCMAPTAEKEARTICRLAPSKAPEKHCDMPIPSSLSALENMCFPHELLNARSRQIRRSDAMSGIAAITLGGNVSAAQNIGPESVTESKAVEIREGDWKAYLESVARYGKDDSLAACYGTLLEYKRACAMAYLGRRAQLHGGVCSTRHLHIMGAQFILDLEANNRAALHTLSMATHLDATACLVPAARQGSRFLRHARSRRPSSTISSTFSSLLPLCLLRKDAFLIRLGSSRRRLHLSWQSAPYAARNVDDCQDDGLPAPYYPIQARFPSKPLRVLSSREGPFPAS